MLNDAFHTRCRESKLTEIFGTNCYLLSRKISMLKAVDLLNCACTFLSIIPSSSVLFTLVDYILLRSDSIWRV